MPLDLPTLGGLATAGGAVLAWFGRLERRIAHKVDRKDYLDDRRDDVAQAATRYGELKTMIESQAERTEHHREGVQRDLRDLGEDMAVVLHELGLRRRRRENRNPHPRSGDDP